MALIISKFKKSPVRPGKYIGRIASIRERRIETVNGYRDVIFFEFLVEEDNFYNKVKTSVFISDYEKSDYVRLKNKLIENYGMEEINLLDHVETDVNVTFDVKKVGNDEYPILVEYSPYVLEELDDDVDIEDDVDMSSDDNIDCKKEGENNEK